MLRRTDMVIYNDIIPFDGYDSMAIFPFIFARKKPLHSLVLNHETIHLHQQFEVLVVSLLVALLLVLFFDASFWWLLAALPVYYTLYGLEYCIRYLVYGDHEEAYFNISFEQEAYLNDGESDYLDERVPFAWVKFLVKKSYERLV